MLDEYERGWYDGFQAAKATRSPDPLNPVKCAKCGMTFQGVMGYYCSDTECPTFMKVSCGQAWGGLG